MKIDRNKLRIWLVEAEQDLRRLRAEHARKHDHRTRFALESALLAYNDSLELYKVTR